MTWKTCPCGETFDTFIDGNSAYCDSCLEIAGELLEADLRSANFRKLDNNDIMEITEYLIHKGYRKGEQ